MPPEKLRDSSRTKERIVAAAQIKFSEKGFDGASTRDIAALADVNVSLVNRYFGSKKGLFQKAILEEISLDPEVVTVAENIPEAISEYLIGAMRKQIDKFDATEAILRSIGNEEIGMLIKNRIKEEIIDQLAEYIPSDDARERATVIIALLFGVDAMCSVLKLSPLDSASDEMMAKLMASAIDRLMTATA